MHLKYSEITKGGQEIVISYLLKIQITLDYYSGLFYVSCLLGDRLVVGHKTLALSTGVRILLPQPIRTILLHHYRKWITLG